MGRFRRQAPQYAFYSGSNTMQAANWNHTAGPNKRGRAGRRRRARNNNNNKKHVRITLELVQAPGTISTEAHHRHSPPPMRLGPPPPPYSAGAHVNPFAAFPPSAHFTCNIAAQQQQQQQQQQRGAFTNNTPGGHARAGMCIMRPGVLPFPCPPPAARARFTSQMSPPGPIPPQSTMQPIHPPPHANFHQPPHPPPQAPPSTWRHGGWNQPQSYV
jgi:hypothetical protein